VVLGVFLGSARVDVCCTAASFVCVRVAWLRHQPRRRVGRFSREVVALCCARALGGVSVCDPCFVLANSPGDLCFCSRKVCTGVGCVAEAGRAEVVL